MSLTLRSLNLRLLPVQIGILVCFALMTTWLRMPVALFGLTNYYNARFSLLVAMLVTIALWFATGMPGFRRMARSRTRALFMLTLLILVIWAYMSGAWAYVASTRPHIASNAALAWTVAALFVVVVASAAPTPRAVVGVLVACITIVALITIAQSVQQRSLGLYSLGEFTFFAGRDGVSILNAGEQRYVRPYGLYPHPNMLGGLLMTGVLLVASVLLSERKVLIPEDREKEAGEDGHRGATRRLLSPLPVSSRLNTLFSLSLLASLAFIFYALLLTFSRAAWIGLAAGAVALLPHVRLRVWRLLPLVAIAVVVGGAFVWQYRPLLAVRTGVATESIELRSVADRVVYTDFALRAIEEQPLLGQGAGNFPWRAAAYIEETFFDLKGDHVHHVFLGVWAELGAVGFGLFVLALALGVEASLRAMRERAGYILPLPAVIAFAVVGLFDHYPYSQLPFMALWWGMLAAAAYEPAG